MPRKKIHRFLVDSPIEQGDIVEITDQRIVHQVGRVLKMEPGEVLAVFSNGSGDVVGQIELIDKQRIVLEKINESDPLSQKRTVIACIAIPKGDTFELIVQKLTELGVDTVVPLITSRTIKHSVRLERLQAISDEALEQSGGSTRVTICEPMTIRECLAQFPFQSYVYEPGTTSTIDSTDDTVVMYIGPEGGWSEEDIQLLKESDVHWQSLGDRILRTETAAIVGAFSILNA